MGEFYRRRVGISGANNRDVGGYRDAGTAARRGTSISRAVEALSAPCGGSRLGRSQTVPVTALAYYWGEQLAV